MQKDENKGLPANPAKNQSEDEKQNEAQTTQVSDDATQQQEEDDPGYVVVESGLGIDE